MHNFARDYSARQLKCDEKKRKRLECITRGQAILYIPTDFERRCPDNTHRSVGARHRKTLRIASYCTQLAILQSSGCLTPSLLQSAGSQLRVLGSHHFAILSDYFRDFKEFFDKFPVFIFIFQFYGFIFG